MKENLPINPLPLPQEPDRVPTITVDLHCYWMVKLTYFTSSGKYYSNGEYMSYKKNLYEIWNELQQLLKSGTRPGLIDGRNQFYVLVEVPTHPHNHLHLILPQNT